MRDCPECKGTGLVPIHDRNDGNNVMSDCPACDGTGDEKRPLPDAAMVFSCASVVVRSSSGGSA